MTSCQEKRVAFLAADGVEQVELTEPWEAVEEAGGKPELVSVEDGQIQGFNHLDKADTFDVDIAVAAADASKYDGLVLPGGVANPDFLRDRRGRRGVRPQLLRGGQAGGRDLPRPMDARGGRRPARAQDHLLAERKTDIATPARSGSTRRSWWTPGW